MAYEICETRQLIPEMVYLLSKMGHGKKALEMIIEKLDNIQMAIEFIKMIWN